MCIRDRRYLWRRTRRWLAQLVGDEPCDGCHAQDRGEQVELAGAHAAAGGDGGTTLSVTSDDLAAKPFVNGDDKGREQGHGEDPQPSFGGASLTCSTPLGDNLARVRDEEAAGSNPVTRPVSPQVTD